MFWTLRGNDNSVSGAVLMIQAHESLKGFFSQGAQMDKAETSFSNNDYPNQKYYNVTTSSVDY